MPISKLHPRHSRSPRFVSHTFAVAQTLIAARQPQCLGLPRRGISPMLPREPRGLFFFVVRAWP